MLLNYGVVFHHFHDNRIYRPSQGSIDGIVFRKVLEYIQQNYNLISATEWYSKFLDNSLAKDDIVITFDDALKCQYDIASEVLDEFNINGFWFIYTSILEGNIEKLEVYREFRHNFFDSLDDFYEEFFRNSNIKVDDQIVESYISEFPLYSFNDRKFRYIRDQAFSQEEFFQVMEKMIGKKNTSCEEIAKNLWISKEEIKELTSKGHIIGLHSHTHPTDIKKYSYKTQLFEYGKNSKIIEEITGKKPFSMSHPCNSYNDTTLKVLNELGIKVGFRADMSKNSKFSNYEFPRVDHSLLVKNMSDEK